MKKSTQFSTWINAAYLDFPLGFNIYQAIELASFENLLCRIIKNSDFKYISFYKMCCFKEYNLAEGLLHLVEQWGLWDKLGAVSFKPILVSLVRLSISPSQNEL